MKSGFLKNIFPIALLCACAARPDPDAEIFLAQARADPELRIADAYKWLFHAARGGEHAIHSESAVRQWLDQEWATLGPPHPDEPLWVPLAPDGRNGRLNLRPYQAQGGDPAALHAAFLASAASFEANPARFRAAWRALGQALKTRPQGHLTCAEWKRFDREQRANGYPACHHSAEYEQARHPAYRVLTAAAARKLQESLGIPPSQSP